MSHFLPRMLRAIGGTFSAVSPAACCALILLGAPVGVMAQDKVIYPRSSAPAEPAAPIQASGTNTSLLFLAVAAAGVGGWLLWRQRSSVQSPNGREARKLSVTETRSLGNRQYLVVADYNGQKFLLGVCPGRIDLLSNLDGTTPPRSP